VKAALLVLLLLTHRQNTLLLEVREVFASRSDFRLGGGDWRQHRHFFLFSRLGRTVLKRQLLVAFWAVGLFFGRKGGEEAFACALGLGGSMLLETHYKS
jgi:hypothetical protein